LGRRRTALVVVEKRDQSLRIVLIPLFDLSAFVHEGHDVAGDVVQRIEPLGGAFARCVVPDAAGQSLGLMDVPDVLPVQDNLPLLLDSLRDDPSGLVVVMVPHLAGVGKNSALHCSAAQAVVLEGVYVAQVIGQPGQAPPGDVARLQTYRGRDRPLQDAHDITDHQAD
jgi:hypothetical protein